MFEIKKYAASGLFEGQTVKEFESIDDASEYLESLKTKREGKGYECETQEEDGLTVKLELTHGDLAEVYVYEVFPILKSEINL